MFRVIVFAPSRFSVVSMGANAIFSSFHVPTWTKSQVSADECAELDEAADRDAEKGGGVAAGTAASSEAVSDSIVFDSPDVLLRTTPLNHAQPITSLVLCICVTHKEDHKEALLAVAFFLVIWLDSFVSICRRALSVVVIGRFAAPKRVFRLLARHRQ